MNFKINSKKLDTVVEFSRPGAYYIYVDFSSDKRGTLGKQICSGGQLTGKTLSYSGNDEKVFKKICKNWFRKFIENGLF